MRTCVYVCLCTTMHQKNKFLLLFYVFIFFGFITINFSIAKKEEKICKSFNITEPKDLELLKNCTIVVGYVRIVNLDLTTVKAIPATFVEEITDYLLVYRAYGLTTLQHIFPHLKLIRGHDLLFDKYSLVILENREIENLGLISLLRVQKGNIRIERNPVLCFVDTVNWVYILGNAASQNIYFKNKPSNECPICNETFGDKGYNDDGYLQKHCWSLDYYQRNTTFGNLYCKAECGIYGCDSENKCCSSKCLTGCSNENCELCATFNASGHCDDMCKGFYMQDNKPETMLAFNKRECITQRTCQNNLIPFYGVCRETCPASYQPKNGVCEMPCSGHYVIHTSKDLDGLKDCKCIQGSVTIELKEVKEKVINGLEEAFKKVTNITGYLKIKNSPQLVSLEFLSALNTINGDELIDKKYALYVVNNNHLEQLWTRNRNVAIDKGRVFFHLNPRLCYEKIVEWARKLKTIEKISAAEISPNSNGERTVCGENIKTINVTIEDFNATAARILVEAISVDYEQNFLGYTYFYKETDKNVTHYDGRHGCGHDDWLMDISTNKNVRYVIGNLKPYTRYAYFVKTITITEYHNFFDAYSEIQYFTTLPSKPGPVAKIYYHTISFKEIMIHWWPPHSPNGNITSYLINNVEIQENNTESDATKFFSNTNIKDSKDICECKMKEPFYSGPLPADENYYNKEELTYDEALGNFMFVKLEQPIITKPKNVTQKIQNLNVTISQSELKNNSTEAIQEKSKFLTDASEILNNLNRENERKFLAKQDTGIADFPIIKSCVENESCKTTEHYDGISVSGNTHFYLFDKLDENKTYEISVRACLENGVCGGQIKVLAKTFSKVLDDFIQNAPNLSNDIEQ